MIPGKWTILTWTLEPTCLIIHRLETYNNVGMKVCWHQIKILKRDLYTANIPKEIFINCLFLFFSSFSFPLCFLLYYWFYYMWLFWEIKTDTNLFLRFLKCDILPRTVEVTLLVAAEALSLCCVLLFFYFLTFFFTFINKPLRSSLLTHCREDGLWQADGSWWECDQSCLPWPSAAHLPPSHYVVARQQLSVAAGDWWRSLN